MRIGVTFAPFRKLRLGVTLRSGSLLDDISDNESSLDTNLTGGCGLRASLMFAELLDPPCWETWRSNGKWQMSSSPFDPFRRDGSKHGT